jgi:hypothetical protein
MISDGINKASDDEEQHPEYDMQSDEVLFGHGGFD